MPDAPDVATASLIDSADIGLSLGSNLFRGPVRDVEDRPSSVPHCAVFCLVSGGAEPLRYINGNLSPRLRYSNVQVTIRSDVISVERSFENGQTLARQVWEVLEAATVTGYIKFDARGSEPNYVGVDETDHHRWTINLETLREE